MYCINAARYLFRSEPTEVLACSVNSDPDRLPEIDETTSAILRFEGERVASFVTSFNVADAGWYEVLGTKGRLKVEPAYEYAEGLAYEITTDGRTTKRQSAKRDQFAAELIYFSKCILEVSTRNRPAKRACRTCALLPHCMNQRRLDARFSCRHMSRSAGPISVRRFDARRLTSPKPSRLRHPICNSN